jgi:hypothetical protein
MKRILLTTLAFLACGLHAEQLDNIAPLKKAITTTDLVAFETAFDTQTISPEQKDSLAQLARVTRAKLQTELDALGNHTGNAPTFLTGLAQGAVGLWALLNTALAGLIAFVPVFVENYEGKKIKYQAGLPFFIPAFTLPFCCTSHTTTPDAITGEVTKTYNPYLVQQLPRLWTGCALTGIPFGVLTIYAFYKAGINIRRGLNYNKYLQAKISNLDIMLEYLV